MNVLVLQEMRADLAHLAHRCCNIDKYREETCCVIGKLPFQVAISTLLLVCRSQITPSIIMWCPHLKHTQKINVLKLHRYTCHMVRTNLKRPGISEVGPKKV